MNLKYVCRICNYECTSKNIGQHLRYSHKDLNITAKNYYDTYLKKSTDGICKICGNPTSFKCISEGYKLTCSKKCGDILSAKKTSIALKNKSVEDKRAIREKIEKTNIERYGVKCIFDTFTSETYKIPDEKLKCMHDNNIKIIGKYEIKQYLKYCKNNGINLIAYKCKD